MKKTNLLIEIQHGKTKHRMKATLGFPMPRFGRCLQRSISFCVLWCHGNSTWARFFPRIRRVRQIPHQRAKMRHPSRLAKIHHVEWAFWYPTPSLQDLFGWRKEGLIEEKQARSFVVPRSMWWHQAILGTRMRKTRDQQAQQSA